MTTIEAETTLRSLACQACAKHADILKAVAFVRARLRGEQALMDVLLDPIIESAVRIAVYSARHDLRTQAKNHNQCPRGKDAKDAATGTMASSLLDIWIIGGKTLRECLGIEVRCEMEMDTAKRDGYSQNIRLYDGILAKVKDDEIVGDKLSDRQAENLWNKVAGE